MALLEEIIASCCFPGSVLLVPFLGSGVTLRAGYKLNHTGFGYDLDAHNKEAFLKKVFEDTQTGAVPNWDNPSGDGKGDVQ